MESLRGQDGGEMVLPTYHATQSARSTPCGEAVLLVATFIQAGHSPGLPAVG